MAQTQATSTTGSTDGNGDSKQREAKIVTPIEAITKITKILDQLSQTDRKRVLAFVNESNPSGE